MGWSRMRILQNHIQKWLDNILIYLTHNERKPVVAENFKRTVRGKIYKTMTANDSKSYHGYLNKLVDEYNNTYNRSIGKTTIDADYSALIEEIEKN